MLKREKISLGGYWDYSTPYAKPIKRKVPGSYHCVGTCTYSRTIQLPPTDKRRALLCFEGIAYQGDVKLNGIQVGETMQPYSRYTMDVTSALEDGENELVVELADLPAAFGPSEGWESSSGIIRDVYVEYVPQEYIENIFFHQQLNESFGVSDITVEVAAVGGDSARIRIALDGAMVLEAESKPDLAAKPESAHTAQPQPSQAPVTITAQLHHPRLWSPETPILYDLTVELIKNGAVVDATTEKIGFKDFSIKGNRFLLNGQPCFLKGVCRHDMWGEQGLTLTDAQIEQDLQMIKDMGVNYIRLVHYPHDVRVVDAADRLGLLISEEPGLWWSDMHNPGVTGGALEVMKRTILRDRSRVSVAFWLAFNECIFTAEFLDDAQKLVRALDPYRAVSGASCQSLKFTKDLYDKCNWDFYTFHPYGALPSLVSAGHDEEGRYLPPINTIDETVAYFKDKPLVFTEWGGYYVHDNPNLYKLFNQKMASYAAPREDGLHLAGMAYWCWNDIYQTSRGLPGCIDGILMEGLVDIHRNKRVNYYTQADCFHEFDCLQPTYPGEVSIIGMDVQAKKQTVVDIYIGQDLAANNDAFSIALEAAKPNIGFVQLRTQLLDKGPVLPHNVYDLGELETNLESRAPLIAYTSPVEVPVGLSGDTLCLVGMTVLGDAFPISGKAGDVLGKLVINYTDGTAHTQELLDGKELCTAFMSYGASRIDPCAGDAKRVLTFSYDKNWERYCMNVLTIPLCSEKTVDSVKIVPVSDKLSVLLYGITVLGNVKE